MAFVDIILGGMLAYGLVRGIWNGFFIELASLLSLIAGIWAAIKFSHLTRAIIESHLSWNPKTITTVAFILTFILVVVGITILAKAMTAMASLSGLGIFNKLFGGVFGVIKMALIVSVTLNVFNKINGGGHFVDKQTIDNSLFYNPIVKIAAKIYPAIEEWYANPTLTSTP